MSKLKNNDLLESRLAKVKLSKMYDELIDEKKNEASELFGPIVGEDGPVDVHFIEVRKSEKNVVGILGYLFNLTEEIEGHFDFVHQTYGSSAFVLRYCVSDDTFEYVGTERWVHEPGDV